MLPKTSRTLLALAVACGAGAALTPAAHAAFPGENGQVAFTKNLGDGLWRLHLADPGGTNVRALGDSPDPQYHPAWSPDGTRIAYSSGNEAPQLRVVDPATGVDVPLDVDGTHPTWSPDGKQIAYEHDGDIFVRSSDPTVTAEPVLLTPGSGYDEDPAWSAKGEIAFIRTEQGINQNVFVMPATGDLGGAASPVSRHAGDESDPDWSPDGTTLVYVRDQQLITQQPTKVAVPFQPAVEVVDVDAVWAPDGTQILWRSSRKWQDVLASRLWVSPVAGEAGTATPLGGGGDPVAGITGLQPDWQPVVKDDEPEDPEEPQEPEDPKDDEDPKDEQPRDEQSPAPQPPAPQPPTPQVQQPQPRPQAAAPRVVPAAAVVRSRTCVSRRRFTITLPSKGSAVRSATATLGGKALDVTVTRKGRAVVDLRTKPKGTFTVKITVRTADGTVKQTRRYRTCTPKRRA